MTVHTIPAATPAVAPPSAGHSGDTTRAVAAPPAYLLPASASELERLRLQARVWEPEAETLLDRIGVQPGWRCADLGCGAMGILGPLSRRVGPTGRILGLD